MSNEKKKVSEIEKRIADKLGDKGKEEKKAVFVCSLDNEKFEKFGHLARWYREVHGVSLMKFAEQLYHDTKRLEAKIAELEQKGV